MQNPSHRIAAAATQPLGDQAEEGREEEEEREEEEDDLLIGLTEEELRLVREEGPGPGSEAGTEAGGGSTTQGGAADNDAFWDEEGVEGFVEGEEIEVESMSKEDIALLDRASSGALTTAGRLAPLASASDPSEADADAESREFAVALAKVASDTKGSDITVLHVAPLVYWTSYMVLVTVFSRPQLNAILGKAEKEARERFNRSLDGVPGPGRSPWEVLDFGDVVLHVFTYEQREFYDLESFYGMAEEVALPFPEEADKAAAAPSWTRKLR